MSSTSLGFHSPSFLDDTLKKEKAYWLQKLAGQLEISDLPLDFRRPATFNGEQATLDLELEPEIAARLLKVCNNTEELVLAVLITSLKLCLYRYTGIQDSIIGTTIHKRYQEIATVNKVLLLRNQIEPTMTARQALVAVQRALSEAYANQKYPLDRIIDQVGLEFPENRAPLFSAMVLLTNINNPEHARNVRNDLTLTCSMEGGTLSGNIAYRTSLFKREAIAVLREHYVETLRSLLTAPDQEIATLDLLSAARRQTLVVDYNQTERPYPSDQTIHQLFEAQAARTPDRIAVTFGEHTLTYAELDRRANQLARHLQSLGLGPGKFVGLYLEHSLETIVAILGVLKVGSAYVPLDPEHPQSRVTFVLEDAQIGIVLTQERLYTTGVGQQIQVICLDTNWATIAQESTEPLAVVATPDQPAYMIYTSGSTGTPKGVIIQHTALVNYIWWAQEVYVQGKERNFPLYSSLAFDLTVTSIYTPLIGGNRVVIYPKNTKAFPVLTILEENQVQVLKLTPSHLALIADRDNRSSQVEVLIVGGEALDRQLAAKIHASFGGKVEILNEYGPTEATVGCMLYRFDPAIDDRAFVPIGRPANNAQIYILDEALRPVADNISGELCISGAGLAQGYLNRPELTAERFIDHPLLPGKKLYKTGDLARWLPEGQIEFIGRADDQIKFHGYRIELNEIRHALNQHAQIRDSVVTVAQDHDGSDVLIAYYVASEPIEAGLLRAFMAEWIIEETIPNLFARIDSIPLTVNGKIDFAQLPTVDEARQQVQQVFVAPRDEMEAALAAIWEQVLGVERVSIYDNFFDLGGHSLLATQVFSRVRAMFQVELPLSMLFDTPTISGMAALIRQQQATQPQADSQSISPIARADSSTIDLDQLSDEEVEAMLQDMVEEDEIPHP